MKRTRRRVYHKKAKRHYRKHQGFLGGLKRFLAIFEE